MATHEEVAERARLMADGVLAPDMADWRGWSHAAIENACVLAIYIIRQRRAKPPQRRALRLFRSWLSDRERAELRRSRRVTVTGSEGGTYRIIPAAGVTQRVERHGRRWFARAAFCLHPDEWLPPADIALAHYLLLRTDEPAFLARANEHRSRSRLWDGAYLRRLNSARRARATGMSWECRPSGVGMQSSGVVAPCGWDGVPSEGRAPERSTNSAGGRERRMRDDSGESVQSAVRLRA